MAALAVPAQCNEGGIRPASRPLKLMLELALVFLLPVCMCGACVLVIIRVGVWPVPLPIDRLLLRKGGRCALPGFCALAVAL